MRSLYITLVLSLIVVARCSYEPPKEDDSCDCSYCEATTDNTATTTLNSIYFEDTDGDGNRTICARDRDLNDRTFSSVCHMICFNRCTRLRYILVTVDNAKQYDVNAYRTNYYKLRDGEC